MPGAVCLVKHYGWFQRSGNDQWVYCGIQLQQPTIGIQVLEEEPVPLVEHLEIIDEGTVILEIDAPLPEVGSISVTDSTGDFNKYRKSP